jgi:nucleoside-diphosphate-sugar epimerase
MHGRFGRFVLTSSTSVYGQDRGESIDENSPCEPSAENGRIILESEEVLQKHGTSGRKTDAFSYQILRLAGIYGPGRLLRRIESLKAGEPLEGRGDAWLNLIHVNDAANIVVACTERDDSGTTLVCDDRPVERREYYATLARLAGATEPRFVGEPNNTESGLNKRCSNRKLREDWKLPLEFPTYETGLPHALHSS